MIRTILAILILFFSPCFSKQKKYDLAICAIFQDDAKYLPEWIDFHRSQGVEHFYLYNNLSSDDYQGYLHRYIKLGVVELIEWPYKQENVQEWNDIQCRSYMDCIEKNKDKCKWIAFLDTDEFLFSVRGKLLTKVMRDYEDYAGVGVNWMLYGTSNQDYIPKDKRMIDLLTYRAASDHVRNIHIKSIVQPKYVLNCHNPHFFEFKDNLFAVTEKKQRVDGPFSEYPRHKVLRINHYWSRDKDFFFNVKCTRQKKWCGSFEGAILLERECNLIWDPISDYIKY